MTKEMIEAGVRALATLERDVLPPSVDRNQQSIESRLLVTTIYTAMSAASVDDEMVERDWVSEAARLSLDAADRPPALRSALGGGIQHGAWMLTEIEEGRIVGRKAHRWLGYAQGLLVENCYLTLDEAKDANKQASALAAVKLEGVGEP